jgi:hypothetical protein
MVKLGTVPEGLDEIVSEYGDPDPNEDMEPSSAWYLDNIATFRLPYPLRLSWRPETTVTVVHAHKKVGAAIMDALSEIGQYRGGAYLERNRYNYFGGILNVRLKRGGNELSTHSWGIAIDLNPNHAPFGVKNHTQPDFIVRAFQRRGFRWGGSWEYPDAMHFEACRGY